MNDPNTITEALMQPFPAELLDEKNGMTYVPAEYVRERLIAATGNCFDWSIKSVEFREDNVAQSHGVGVVVCICVGDLTIPGMGTRSGLGVQEIIERQGADAAYKGASSDALKRAAMEFGVGLHQLYIETGEAKRAKKAGRNTGNTARTTQRPPVRQHPPAQARETLTEAQFDEKVRQAVGMKNGQQMLELIEDAQDMIGRWCVLVNATESPQALDWVEAKAKHKGIDSQLVKDAIEKRRAEKNWPAPATGGND
jgi:hypothetical protein